MFNHKLVFTNIQKVSTLRNFKLDKGWLVYICTLPQHILMFIKNRFGVYFSSNRCKGAIQTFCSQLHIFDYPFCSQLPRSDRPLLDCDWTIYVCVWCDWPLSPVWLAIARMWLDNLYVCVVWLATFPGLIGHFPQCDWQLLLELLATIRGMIGQLANLIGPYPFFDFTNSNPCVIGQYAYVVMLLYVLYLVGTDDWPPSLVLVGHPWYWSLTIPSVIGRKMIDHYP